MRMPLNIGPLHFVGMGGIGMSAIAEILVDLGYQVQGSDLNSGANIERLKKKGVKAFVGHKAENIEEAQVVVVSSAIAPDNPELVAARLLNKPIILRAEMLGELMRLKSSIAIAGTHGKTTTTSLLASLLVAGKLDPTVVNGGVIEAFGSNARMGSGEWLVAEADESDGSFLRLPAQIGVITNIDPEHLENYSNFDGLLASFQKFITQLPFYGFALLGIDHPNVDRLVKVLNNSEILSKKRILTYGFDPSADVQVFNCEPGAGEVHFDIKLSDAMRGGASEIRDFRLLLPGEYNALNAAAAIGVAHELGVSADDLRSGLVEFKGVHRRFTHIGTVERVQLYDDYAHHPVEVAAVLKAAAATAEKRVIAVMQPHRYSRLKAHFEAFSKSFDDADLVVIAPVYAAGEDPIDGFNSKELGRALEKQGRRVLYIDNEQDLAPLISKTAEQGDLVIGLGAGSISSWMHGLSDKLVTAAA